MIEFLDQSEEYAILFGLSYDEYWYGDFEIFEYKAKMFYNTSDQKIAEDDFLAWMIGAYTRDAVASVTIPLLGGKGKNPKYPDNPQFYAQINAEAKAARDKKKQEQELRNLELMFLQAAKKHTKLSPDIVLGEKLGGS